MIKLKITKNKFIAMVNSVTEIIDRLKQNKKKLEGWPLIHANAHLYMLEELSRKMRSKIVLIETKQGSHRMIFSINEIEAFAFVVNKDIFNQDPYTMAIIEQISGPIFLRLLSK